MSERLGCGEAVIGDAERAVQQLVASLINVDFAAQYARDIDIDVLAHGAHGARIGPQFDYRQNRQAVFLPLSPQARQEHRQGAAGQQGEDQSVDFD